MSRLYLPDKTVGELQKTRWAEERQRQRAVVNELLDFSDPVCERWNPHLKDLDQGLRLARARPVAAVGYGVIPGFYHWVRENELAPLTITPITGPGDTFREPDSNVLEDLKASDLQDPRVFMALLDRRTQEEEEREKRLERDREQRQQDIYEHYLATNRVQVSMKDGWTQNASGRKSPPRG